VQQLDYDDYKKLTRVPEYLCGTKHLPLTLEASNAKLMEWCIDASYGVHQDMKSHTGGVFSLGKGAIYAASTHLEIQDIPS
jgi:hypothetical protein